MIRYSFRMPDDLVHFSDEALSSWAGKTVDITLFGERISGARIVEAFNYEDARLGPGVWVVADAIEDESPVPFTVHEARFCRLDDDGAPVGPTVPLLLQGVFSTGVDSAPMTPDTNDTPEGVEDFTDEEQEAIIEEVPVPDDPDIPQPSQDPDDRAMDAEEQA